MPILRQTSRSGVEDAYALMRAAGYRYVTVPTCDGDRRHIRLEG